MKYFKSLSLVTVLLLSVPAFAQNRMKTKKTSQISFTSRPTISGMAILAYMVNKKLKRQILMLWQKMECCLRNIMPCRFALRQDIH
jgi:hypothetical protein